MALRGCCKIFPLFLRGNSILEVGEPLQACLGLFCSLTGEEIEDLGVLNGLSQVTL